MSGRTAGKRQRRGMRVPGVVMSLIVVVGGLVLHGRLDAPADVPEHGGPTTWVSGAAGDGVADGAFGRWRGDRVDIAATWNDSYEAQINQWTLQPGAEYGDWQGDLDLSIGAIYKDRGESWADAAAGAYDDRWRDALDAVAVARAGLDGTLYLRFAHEFNGEWEPWSVTADEVDDFRAAWSRFRDLQQEILPDAKLVFCPTAETSAGLGLRWTDAAPAPADVDVLSVDFYNQYPYVATVGEFDDRLDATDGTGAPRGLEAHRAFAERLGRPFAISEWNSNADMGDAPEFMVAMRRWLEEHAGAGPGQVLYEIQFNVTSYGDGQFVTYPDGRQPAASAAYRRLW